MFDTKDPNISINFDNDPSTPQEENPQAQNGNTPPPTQTNDEIELLKAEIAQLKESVARAQADFINFRRRQSQELESTIKFASGQCINELLPVIDNLQRAFLHIPEELKDNQWVNGVFAIEKHFLQTLEKLGVKKIPTVGTKADPNFHEIIGVGEKPDTESDVVIDEIEAGYLLHEKVLRPAKVRVQK
ncbi:MAG: nucleotide exchange factor GrpE [Candidatus Abawacabacteria bacterium]|nr:nucleotide exchange factor GrpE [Candidatus Abawacabacteria bacterium]